MPYAVLRYFFGRVDLVSEIESMGWVLAWSCAITAGAITLSTAHLVLRVLLLMAALPTFLTFSFTFTIGRAFSGGSAGPTGFLMVDKWWVVVVGLAIYTVMFLEFAAAKIAPPSENHSAKKRTAALGFAATVFLAGWLGGQDWLGTSLMWATPILAWVVVEALTENPVALPSLFVPFARRGLAQGAGWIDEHGRPASSAAASRESRTLPTPL